MVYHFFIYFESIVTFIYKGPRSKLLITKKIPYMIVMKEFFFWDGL